ncbi:MAG TPA: DUF456 domain-containing protein [Vicinamibacterales bacterium]|nr:DUF456 domain-containing protein [Vicinamibacterales bacterium]
MTVLLWVLAIALIAVGFAGILLPALPGTILIFLGLTLVAWADHFMRVSGWTLAVIGAVGAASYAVDFVAAAFGVKMLGASRRAMAGAALGTVAGLFLGLPGLIAGPFVGAVIGELTVDRDLARAGRVGVAAWLGFAIGMAVKVGLAFLMVGIFVAAWIF